MDTASARPKPVIPATLYSPLGLEAVAFVLCAAEEVENRESRAPIVYWFKSKRGVVWGWFFGARLRSLGNITEGALILCVRGPFAKKYRMLISVLVLVGEKNEQFATKRNATLHHTTGVSAGISRALSIWAPTHQPTATSCQ